MVTSIFLFFSPPFPPFSRNVVPLCTVVACHALAMVSRASCCGQYHARWSCHVSLWFPYCSTLPYVRLYDFPSKSSHGARCYASHCVCSNNICHKCSLRCNSHSQPGLLIYSFVPYRQLEIGAFNEHGGFDFTSCWPTHSLQDRQHSLTSLYPCSKGAAVPFLVLKIVSNSVSDSVLAFMGRAAYFCSQRCTEKGIIHRAHFLFLFLWSRQFF